MPDFASVRIAILQTGYAIEEARTEHGDYDDMCKALFGRGPDGADTFLVLEAEFPESLEPYDLLIITGSKFSVYEGHDWILRTEELIREAFERGVKLVGICFGHQLIAQAMGAKVAKADRGYLVGAQDYRIETPAEGVLELPLFAWHQDQVLSVPEGAEVIASTSECPIAGLRYGETAISLQPHPEFTKGFVAELIEVRRGVVVSNALADEAKASLATPVDAAPIAQLFKDFAVSARN